VSFLEECVAQFGWTGKIKLMPTKYDSYLKKYRAIIREACGLSEEQSTKFGTHSGRRGAAASSRSSGDAPSALRSFASVTSDSWDVWYADSLIPEERAAVATTLAEAVACAPIPPSAKRRKR
jgi:hypothetical protein